MQIIYKFTKQSVFDHFVMAYVTHDNQEKFIRNGELELALVGSTNLILKNDKPSFQLIAPPVPNNFPTM